MPTPSLIPELEQVLSSGSADRRIAVLRRMTDLFVNDSWRYTEDHVGLFDDLLGRLIEAMESQARAEIAVRLAPVSNAPMGVIRALAGDDAIGVAGPVLRQSPRLTEADLLAIAEVKGQGHLLAISGRPRLGVGVTDVLVQRGDREVARSLAANTGAKLSDVGFAALTERARGDDTLAWRVGLRADIPPHILRGLVLQASDVVRARLAAAAGPETRGAVAAVLADVSTSLSGDVAARSAASAKAAIWALRDEGKLDSSMLRDFASNGRFAETIAALAAMADVPIETVERLVTGERPDPVLILGRCLDLNWSTVRVILTTIHQRLAPVTLEIAHANFERLSQPTASRLVQYWRTRPA